jgi:hypothetical protein
MAKVDVRMDPHKHVSENLLALEDFVEPLFLHSMRVAVRLVSADNISSRWFMDLLLS